MSFMNIDELSGKELIVQYVLQCKSQGLFLSAVEHKVIERWLSLVGHDYQSLLLILSEVLPSFFSKKTSKAAPLSFIDKKVATLIKEKSAMLIPGH